MTAEQVTAMQIGALFLLYPVSLAAAMFAGSMYMRDVTKETQGGWSIISSVVMVAVVTAVVIVSIGVVQKALRP